MMLLDPSGGILCSFSCSSIITQKQLLLEILIESNRRCESEMMIGECDNVSSSRNGNGNGNRNRNGNGRELKVMKSLYPGIDHPTDGNYLDGIYLSGYMVYIR